MRRAGRSLYNLATALSLLLCSLTLIVWLRGQAGMMWAGRADRTLTFDVGWHNGRIFAGGQTIRYK